MNDIHNKVDKRYKNSCIYGILNEDEEIIFIGASMDFETRKNFLLTTIPLNKSSQIKLCNFINENGGILRHEINILYKYPCKNRIELLAEQRRAIDTHKPKLNTKIKLNRTKEEYNQYSINYTKQYRTRAKLEKKDESVIKQKKTNIQTNPTKKSFVKIVCECGAIHTNEEIHNKTKKHINYLAFLETKSFLESLKSPLLEKASPK